MCCNIMRCTLANCSAMNHCCWPTSALIAGGVGRTIATLASADGLFIFLSEKENCEISHSCYN